MVIVDVENVRGATSFKLSHAALLSRIRLWREDRLLSSSSTTINNEVLYSSPTMQQLNSIEPMIWVCDHGIRPSIHHFSSSSYDYYSSNDHDNEDGIVKKDIKLSMPCNFGITFAGPQRTADDVIVDIVKLRCQSTNDDYQKEEKNEGNDENNNRSSIPPITTTAIRNTTVVITADTKLISRCQQAQRAGKSLLSDVIFVEPASLLMQLERYRINSYDEETFLGGRDNEKQQQQQPSTWTNGMRMKSEIGKGNVDGKTSTMTSFKDSTIAMEQHAKFQARFQRKHDSKIHKNGEDVVNENNHEIEYDNNYDDDEDDDETQFT
jgi:hypothetical protein